MSVTRTTVRDLVHEDLAWTPRQKQVLDLMTRGRTNAEIASELGVSLYGAKWHVGEILSKLGVDSRDEAAEYWRAYNGLPLRFSRAFRSVGTALATRLVIGATAALVVVAAGVLAFVLLRGGGEPDQAATGTPAAATPSPLASVVPSGIAPTSTPQLIAGIPVRHLALGDPIEVPSGGVLYYRHGCYSCDGGSPNLRRAYRTADGTLVREEILNGLRAASGLPTDREVGGFGVMAGPNPGRLIATVCARPECTAQGVGAPPEAPSDVFRSTDGGVTWVPSGTIPARTTIAVVTNEGTLLAAWKGGSEYDYYYLESGAVPKRPPGNLYPTALGDRLHWYGLNNGALSYYDGNGTLVYRSQFGIAPNVEGDRLISDLDPAVMFTSWGGNVDGTNLPSTYLAKLDSSGRPLEIYSWQSELGGGFPIHSASSTLFFGNILPNRSPQQGAARLFGVEAAMFDLAAGTVRPMTELSEGLTGNANPYVLRWVPGKVLRVTTGSDCLNLRQEPSVTSPSLGCFADGVLLTDLDEQREPQGGAWRRVRSPAGDIEGWASLEFLR